MSPLYMYDGAYKPNLATCKRHGAIAMSHYMTRSYASTSAQPDAIRAAGMGAVMNWEGFAAELKGASRSKGRACGEEALAAMPKGAPRNGTVKIFYSVDTDLTNLSVCDEAFRGINDAHRGTGIQVGLYGEGGLIERLHGMGLVQGGQWLSMSEGFGGFTHALRSGLVAVVQMHDAAGDWIGTDVPGTDRNTILDPHSLGAWWPAGSTYATASTKPTPPAPHQPQVAPRKRPSMLVYRIDPATVPKGVTASGWFTFNGSDVRHVDGPAGAPGKETNNGTSLLKALGQADVVAVTYQQHVDWKAGK